MLKVEIVVFYDMKNWVEKMIHINVLKKKDIVCNCNINFTTFFFYCKCILIEVCGEPTDFYTAEVRKEKSKRSTAENVERRKREEGEKE